MTQQELAPLAPNPYLPPAAPTSPPVADGKRDGWRSVLFIVLAIVLFMAGVFVAGVPPLRFAGALGCLAATLVAGAGGVLGIRALVRISRAPARVAGAGFVVAVVLAVLANGVMAFFGVFLTLFATVGFRRGRQLRSFGRVLLPRVAPGGAWSHLPLAMGATPPDAASGPLAPDAGETLRAALAAQWRENGRTEHASVGAFARLTLDLMALGAPPALVAAANRDALDEIRHTELCFSLARALDGRSESPAPFPAAASARTLPPTRSLALAALAVDSLVDGALHEGVSARVIARLVRRCEEPSIRAVLKEIAADEGRHAAHGWDVAAWCVAEGGAPVADALRGAVAALPREVRSPLPEGARDGGWERLGIHGHALEAEEFGKARADLVERVGRMVGERMAA